MKEGLYNKIDKFCNETNWSKYPTYEHALEEFIKGIVAEETKELEKENAELKSRNAELKGMYAHSAREAETYKQFLESKEKENAELKEQVSYLKDNLRVARKDREELQLDVAKGLKEFVKDYPATALRYLANEKYVEQLTKAKEIISKLLSRLHRLTYTGLDCEECKEAEQFLNSKVEK